MADTWWVDKEDLLEEQLRVLGIGLDTDLLISGPPGSGKTNLLLLRANHLTITQPRAEFYVICYTGLLTKFIRTGAEIYDFPLNRIITKQRLYESVLSDFDMLPTDLREISQDERAAAVALAMTKLRESGEGKDAYPVLFVDEAQDLSAEDLDNFRHLARNLSCAADGRQGLYKSGASGIAWMKQHGWNEKVILEHHYRTAPNILEIADRIMDGKLGHIPMLPTHQYKGDITPVDVHGGVDLAQQLEILIPKIIRQLSIYPKEKIGVIAPRNEEVAAVWAAVSARPELTDSVTNAHHQDFDPGKPVWVSTMHSAKGLEFRCVHMLAADTIRKFLDYSRRLAFTGVTRAKTSLTIYHCEELLPFFASAIAKDAGERITVDRLFGKSKK